MLVITQDTEAAFKKELDFCSKKNESWRCLTFKFSQITKMPEHWFSQALDKISAALGEEGSRVFLYEDNDVYVLSRHTTQKSFQLLLTHLQTLLAPVPVTGLASLFELPMDVNIVKNLRAKEPAKLQAESKPAKPSLRVDTLRQPMVASIARRREKRENIGVLIVEDDPFSQRLVAKSLEDDFAIFTASTGQETISAYIDAAPDVVFLDIGLPDVNGLEVLLKLLEIDPHIYVVMLSGNGSQDNVTKAIQNGAKGFVGKPFSREKLYYYIEKSPFIRNSHKKETLVKQV